MRWRLIIDAGPRPGVENMAIDQALLESVKAEGPPSLRFYRWGPPCLSLGRNQPASPVLAEAAARRGLDIARRPTGGAAVLHDHELTYSVAVPVGALGSPRETYRALNRALVAGLRRLGVAAEVAGEPDGGARPLDPSGPCFRGAAPGEVAVGGLKLVGSAQRRDGRTLLQHGSLLLAGDQALVPEVLAEAESSGSAPPETEARLAPQVATLAMLLGEAPAWDTLVDALAQGFEETLGIALARDELSREEAERARILRTFFGSEEWMWRRSGTWDQGAGSRKQGVASRGGGDT